MAPSSGGADQTATTPCCLFIGNVIAFVFKKRFWSKRQLFVKNNNSPRNLASSKKRLHNPHRRSLVSGFSALSAFVAVVESSDHGGLVP